MITGDQVFLAVVLKPEDDNCFVLSFAGIQMENELPWKAHGDFKTDLDQEKGFVPYQYNRAVSEAQKYKARYGSNLILVGHSLDGGLTSFSSLVHRIPKSRRNSADISDGIYTRKNRRSNLNRVAENPMPPAAFAVFKTERSAK